MGNWLTRAIAGLAAAALAACSSVPSIGDSASSNYAEGQIVDNQLSGADRAALERAVNAALQTGASQSWSGKRATGAVTVGTYSIAGLEGDPYGRTPAARGDLILTHAVETDLGQYVLTRNTNVRIGPGTDNKIAEVLDSGSGVDVVGRVTDRNWMLIAVNGTVRGYVFGDLLIKAPGTELELAGGPVRRLLPCRELSHRVNVYSTREEWDGAACNEGLGWTPAPRGRNRPSNLLGY